MISDGTNSRTHIHPFRVQWVNMPRSLRDFELAVSVLEHIASKEEYSELKRPFGKQRREKFEEFWKKRDPTPHTEFNEAMAEYYRRVDYAMVNFGNKGEGWKTDRGKTYILYGSPSNTERQLSPTAPPREIWTYVNLKRRFIFIDQNRNGNYKLVATEPL
jgi:GWxTD domain-containing protein